MASLRDGGQPFGFGVELHRRDELNLPGPRPLSPPQRLMLAVLEDAARVLEKYVDEHSPQGQELYAEAHDWVLASDHSWPFSFVNVCDALGLEVTYIRRGLIGPPAGTSTPTPDMPLSRSARDDADRRERFRSLAARSAG